MGVCASCAGRVGTLIRANGASALAASRPGRNDGGMHLRLVRFGEVDVDGRSYPYDVVLERGETSRRRKGPSKDRRHLYGHTPLTAAERIPWGPKGSRLVVGTGADGMLPIDPDVEAEAVRRGVELIALPTDEACALLADAPAREVRAILHVTC
jgi:hypothetical protein